MDVQQGSANNFILDLRGKLYKIENDSLVLYMDMAQLKPAFINRPGLATRFRKFCFSSQLPKQWIVLYNSF